MTPGSCRTLVELLRARAESQPDRLAYSFLTDGATAEARLTYRELDRQARVIAARLAQTTAPGERALLLYPPGLEFITAFFGALYAGLVAVPAYPPHAARVERALPRLQGIARDAQPAAALTTASLLGVVERLRGSADEFHGIRALATDHLDARAERWRVPAMDAETLAFIQYTSGSTGTPRGVMLTHGNLLHNQRMIHAAFGLTEASVLVGWLPLYHDMGLIGNVLQTLYVGAPGILMAPVAFLQSPLRWLRAISRYRATVSGGPNFAYDLCVRKIRPEQRAALDLSSWTLAYNGAEPVKAETIERFVEAFAPCGFRREAFFPCYGLAEATLFVTGGTLDAAPAVRHVDARALAQDAVVAIPAGATGSTAFVSCGRSAADQDVVIVEPETRRKRGPGQIGEIWVAGPSVARGYWNRPEETAAVFVAELADGIATRYLRTGDLGFVADGELYVTGRLKDLLIIRGRNHYPQDIEATVERSHAGVRGGAGAACSVEVDGEERVVIVQEVERQYYRAPAAERERILRAIRAAVAAEHEVEVYAIRLVGPGGIPKTSSGKIQRHACRAQFLAGSFDTIAEWTSTPEMAAEDRGATGAAAEASSGVVERIAKTAESIQAWLIARLSERLQVAPEAVDPRGPFSDYGLDSLGAVSLSGDLEEWLGQRLSPTLAWEYPSIEALARHLAGEESPVRGREEAEATVEPIAIIGIGCRFPGAGDAASFWRLLHDGIDAVGEVPVDRWDALAHYDADPGAPGKMNTRWGGFLDEIDRFDAGFFGIAPREAVRMDPQQRLLLEVTWEALHDAGQAPGQLAGSRTGVFVGVSTSDYGQRQGEAESLGDAYAGTGSALSIAANRISYLLNLRGPSLAVDTACSSSLVATHLACASLRSGESTLALCGGVNVILSPLVTVNFTKSGFMSPDGRCKAFDARANGYVRGEGAGIVVLKTLARALADGDPIYAVIRSSAVNQDGRSNGLTAPNPEAQEAVLAEAWQQAGVSPGLAQYVEAHGTGTLLGDPIEAKALGRVVGEGRPPGHVCALGSVKTNIGHLEAAAGIAGLIKVALALRHREIPASLHFETPNPHIPFAEMALRVQRERGPWPDPERRLIAGVSSFGFGGTNAHVVLEEAPDPAGAPAATRAVHARDEDRRHLLPLSAHTPDALRAVAASYRDFLGDDGPGAPALRDICFTAGTRRDHHDHRLALVGRTKRELVDQLERFLRGEPLGPAASGRTRGRRAPRIAFVFSGQGAQWPGMAADLLVGEPSFREAIEHADALLRPHVEWSLLEELRRDPGRPHETERAQPILVALEVALAALWRRWGIAPGAVVGHSMGEIAAACVAGVLSVEEALALAARRGRLMQREAGHGRMAAVDLSAEDARSAVAPYGDRLAVAAWNTPTSTVLSGESAALEEMLASLAQRGIGARVLPGDVAFHSPQMAQSGAELARALADLRPRPSTVRLVSTVTGREVDGLDLTAEYWGRNAREPVRFAEAIEGLLDDDYDVFVEVGPHPVLSPAIAECARRRGRELTIVHSLRRHHDASLTMRESVAALYCAGAVPDWAALCGAGGSPVALPAYPWQRERFWLDSVAAPVPPSGAGSHPLIGARLGVARPTWESRLARPELAYLDEHRVQGRVVLSASAGIEMALAAAAEVSGGEGWLLQDVDFPAACVLPEGRARVLQTALGPDDSSFTICGAPTEGERSWTVHVRGTVHALDELAAAEAVDLGELRARCSREIPRGEVYRALSAAGLEYGPGWSGIERLWRGDTDALGLIRVPAGTALPDGPYVLHPALLDACFQVIAGVLISSQDGEGEGHAGRPAMCLPVALRRARVYRRGAARLWSHVVLEAHTADRLVARVRVFDDAGRPVLDAEGLVCRAIDRAPAARLDELLYEHQWRPSALTRARAPLPAPGAIARTVSVAAGGYATELGLNARYAALEPELDALCAAYILKAFSDLGGAPRPGERLSAEALGARLGIAPRHRRLLDRYLAILGEDGYLRRIGDEWEAGAEAPASAPVVTWRGLLARYPAFYGELVLLERCAGRLAEILRGECDPLELIFPEGSLAAAEQLYQDAPSTRLSNALVRRAIAAMAAALPAGRPLRVLEIGAGTGGVTAHALPALPDETRYVFTDVSPQFLGKAEDKFRRHPGIEYRRLDIEADPLAQGFQANAFDLVLASQVLHATTDLRRTLAHVGTLLASDGWLVLLETVRPARWVDLVFGLTEGWWRFADRELRPSHPLLSLRSWRALLTEAGFCDVQEASGRPEDAVENAVILARGPRIESAPAPRPVPSDIGAELGRWLVFADRGGIGERVVGALSARGARCVQVFAAPGHRRRGVDEVEMSPGSATDMERVLREALGQGAEACRGIIHLWNLDAPSPDEASTQDLESAQTAGSTSVVHLVQALASVDAAAPRLWLVTRGAEAVRDADAPLSVAQAPVWGLGRVIASEMPKLRATLVDLGNDPGDADIRALVDEVAADDGEGEIALRDGVRHVHRYVRRPEGTRQIVPMKAGQFRLEISTPGWIDSLTLVAAPRREPQVGEIEIEVVAAALNWKDVMKALGLAPPSPDATPILGLECSGRVSRVGPDVEGIEVGSEVIAIAPHCLAPYVTTRAGFVALKPPHVSFEEAATVPIAFLTASYALRHLGRLAEGERVLIHSATGGVGLAAVQLAARAGAEVFATAGTSEKRGLLRALGVRHVMDSRSTAFAGAILDETGGAGVDLVLNSLTGEAIARGLSVLSDYGRFLEIGKHDISRNSRLGLAPFEKNLSFFGIDLDRALRDRPRLMSALLREIVGELGAGALAPLPHRVFPVSNATGAFRYMAMAQHIGKVVVSLEERDAMVAVPPPGRPLLREDATYLISGGLGGFGLALARWMVERGARHLVLMGRRGDDADEARSAVMALRGAGAEVMVAAADVTRGADVARVLRDIEAAMPPLRGVAHAAMVLEDSLLVNLDEARFDRVRAPKVSGAWNLHTQTLGAALDFFVLFSSMSSVFGIPGQASYAAANAFVDALAHHRRARGLPALAINWGYLGEVGWVARQPAVAARLEGQGVSSFSPGEALAVLDRLLREDAVQAGVMRIDWLRWAAASGAASISPRFARLVEEAAAGQSRREQAGLDRRALLAAPPEERRARLLAYLRAQVGRVLGLPAGQVDVEQPVGRLGLDSLMAVELRNRLEADLGIGLAAVTLLEGPSVAALTTDLLARLDEGAPPVPLADAAPLVRTGGAEAPLSSAQRWMWVLHQLGPGQPWCNVPFALRLRGVLDVPALGRSFAEIARRHEVLRTRFPMVDDRPVARVVPDPGVALAMTDLGGLPEPEREVRVRELAAEESRRPFDLEGGPLWRAALIRLGERDHVLLVTMHHIVTDGWSLDVLLRELEALYPALRAGRPSPLAELPIQYADFARWEQSRLASESLRRQLDYWKRRLADAPAALEFPTDHRRTGHQAYRGAAAHLALPAELVAPLRELARAEACTLYMTMLAAFDTLLFRYTGQDDLTVGSFVSSRTRPELDGLVGCFVNHLVLRADLSGNPSFRALLGRVREATLEAYAHQDVPLQMLLDALSVRRDSSRTPLFQVAFAFDPALRRTLPGLSVADLGLDYIHSNFDFTLRVREDGDGASAPADARLNLTLEYNAALFEPVTIERLLKAFRALVAGIGADPDQKIGALPLLSAAEHRELLAGESGAPEPPPRRDRPAGALESIAAEKLRLARRKRAPHPGGEASMKGT